MPVLRSKTAWRTKSGRVRVIRLYRSYKNMIGRVRGWNYDGTGNKRWLGLKCDFYTFTEFRAWALRNGYSLERNSLDRLDPSLGYSPRNCQWITRGENSQRVHGTYRKAEYCG